jgi:twitching motility protein PilT
MSMILSEKQPPFTNQPESIVKEPNDQNADKMTVDQLVKRMVAERASDIHINAGGPPLFRVDGKLIDLGYPKVNPDKCKELAYSVLSQEQIKRFEDSLELDFSFGVAGVGRLRANIYVQRGAVGLALRNIPFRIPSFDELGLPKVISLLCEKPKGLVLITGPTGYGKSTTLAAMIDYINNKFEKHIITIEDPIEYLHRNKKSMVTQREVMVDTQSFYNSLRTILRQDPDVVLIGEMRDLETIMAALTIAETGHLTLATLHTNSAVETINRIVDAFDSNKQPQIRAQLSFVLEGIVAQQLIPRSNGPGRVLAAEIMVPNMAIRNLIREGKTHQVYSIMQTSQSNTIMQTMNRSLLALYQSGEVSYQELMYRATDRVELMEMLNNLKRTTVSTKKTLFGKK